MCTCTELETSSLTTTTPSGAGAHACSLREALDYCFSSSLYGIHCPASGVSALPQVVGGRAAARHADTCVCVHLSSRICQLSTPSTQSPQAFCYYHPHPQNRTMGSEYSPWISFAMMVSSSSVTSNKYHHGGSSGSASFWAGPEPPPPQNKRITPLIAPTPHNDGEP